MMRQVHFLRFLVCSAFLLASTGLVVACGSDDDNGDNELQIKFTEPTIDIDPIRYDFSASVGPGDEEEAVFVLSNIGAEELTISEIRINPLSDDVFFEGQNFPTSAIILDSLESHEFSVWYRPQDGDEHSGALNMNTTDPERPSATVPLAAEAHTP